MSFYSIPMDALSIHFNIPVEQLKDKTYRQLEELETIMNRAKADAQTALRLQDKNMVRIILEHFTALPLMLRYWSFEDSVYHILMHTTRTDIITETPVSVDEIGMNNYHAARHRLLETRNAHIKQYTSRGEELADMKYCRCNIYEVPSQYQHLSHAKPIRDLLLQTFPALAAFDMKIYGITSDINDYQIYIKAAGTTWYIPFDALMRHDADAIFEATNSYAKSYNHGNITPSIIEKAALSEEGKKFFDTIRSLPDIQIRSDDEVQAIITEKKGLYDNVNANPD